MTLCTFTCPRCNQSITMELPDGTQLGKVICPHCQSVLTIKVPSEPPPIPDVPTVQAESSRLGPAPSSPPFPPAEPQAPPDEILSPADTLDGTQPNRGTGSSPEASVVPPALEPYAPPTAPVSVAPEHACPLCGRSDAKYTVRGKMLYGHKVCKKCYVSFLNRRQIAFVLDIVVFQILTFGLSFVGGFIIGFILATTQGEVTEEELASVELTFNVFGFALYALWFLWKDGFNGTSPGKAIMGVFVINEATGKRISFGDSAKRNWIIALLGIVPFAWLIIAMAMGKGYRIGDRGAKTKVVWKKYQHSPVFAPSLGAVSPRAL